MADVTRVVILGGGPGGYEAALVAAQLGAEVTVVERNGLGGSAVLTDCVPSKTLVATAELMTDVVESPELGVRFAGTRAGDTDASRVVGADIATVDTRVKRLAQAQSDDIGTRLAKEGVSVLAGTGRLDGPERVVATLGDGRTESLDADVVLIATGAHPRVLPDAEPDGERILTWTQVYDLEELPEHLVVVGSGVTGAEFASAYQALGSPVTLVSSRDRVLPGEDADAAQVLEDVFRRRGMTVLSRSRAAAVRRNGAGVVVTLTDGRTVEGSHCLMAVGSIPNTADLGLAEAGVTLDRDFIVVDRVSRTTARGVYAAGDCTGLMMLASVAAMQGRIAMWHALGEAVSPLRLRTVSSTVFTDPEIATVGVIQPSRTSGSPGPSGQSGLAGQSGSVESRVVKLPLATNARAKMQGVHDGFVKLFCSAGTSVVTGGVVVAPRASELIFPVGLAVELGLTVDQVAHTFTVYPSLSGSIAEAARQLHARDPESTTI